MNLDMGWFSVFWVKKLFISVQNTFCPGRFFVRFKDEHIFLSSARYFVTFWLFTLNICNQEEVIKNFILFKIVNVHPNQHSVIPPKKIWHNYCFQFLFGRLYKYPGEMKNKGCAKFWGTNKVHYGKRGSGVTVLRKRDEIREVRLL